MKPMKEPTVRYNESGRKIEAWDERSKQWRTLRTDVAPNCKEALRLKSGKPVTESRKSKTQELYESMGLSPEQAKIAANLERGVVTGNANRIFESGLAMGMSIAEARIFSNPNLTLEEASKK
jgi:hypothetical protein